MKRPPFILLTLILSLFHFSSDAQKRLEFFGDGIVNSGEQIITTSDQGYLVLGDVTFGGLEETHLVKFHGNGKIDWTVGSDFNEFYDVYENDNGNFIAIATKRVGNIRTFYYLSYNAQGELLWEINSGNQYSTFDELHSGVVPTQDGHHLFYCTNEGNYFQGKLSKVDESGNIVWNQTLSNSSGPVRISLVQETSNGKIIATGSWGSQQSFLAELDNDGTILNQYEYDFHTSLNSGGWVPQEEWGRQLIIEPDGYILLGASNAKNGNTLDSDAYMAKIALDGSIVFNNHIPWLNTYNLILTR